MEYRSTSERVIEEAINSGQYSMASLQIFDTITHLDISDKLINHLEYTEEILKEHLEEVETLKDKKPGLTEYLKAIKAADVVDNQSFEKENTFLIGLYMQVKKENAIDKIIKLLKQKGELTASDICRVHNTLLYGTSSEDTNLIRTKNDKFVGKIDKDKIIIDYLPIERNDVKTALDQIAKIYNSKTNSESYNNVLLKPFLIHGLFGAFQLFDDGNTRIGRLMQHALMWQLINEKMGFNFDTPPIYTTRSYFPYRGEYRDKIASLVVDNNTDAWNKWFDFNLNRIEDQVYGNSENIKALKRKLNL